VALAIVVCLVISVTGFAHSANAASLTSPTWSSSNTVMGPTGVSYTYTFTTATSQSFSSVAMTVPALEALPPSAPCLRPASPPEEQ